LEVEFGFSRLVSLASGDDLLLFGST